MSRTIGRLSVPAVALLCVVLQSPFIVACTCESYDIGYLAGSSIEVPRNARGILWAGGLHSPKGDVVLPPLGNFRVDKINDDQWESVPFQLTLLKDPRGTSEHWFDTLLVSAKADMQAGERYRFVYYARSDRALGSVSASSALDSQVVIVTVSDSEFVGYSSELTGEKVQTGRMRIEASSACSIVTEAKWIDIDNVLPVDLRKWEDSLFYTTLVWKYYWRPREDFCDPDPPGRSWRGIGGDCLYHIDLSGVIDGRIRELGIYDGTGIAYIYAWLPGTDEVFTASVHYSFLE